MSIYLRCRNISVSEHALDHTKLRSMIEQMRGKRVPKRMWGDDHVDARKFSVFTHLLKEIYTTERLATSI